MNDITPQSESKLPEPPERNKSMPRFAGIFAGLFAGFFVAKYLLQKSLYQLVNDRSMKKVLSITEKEKDALTGLEKEVKRTFVLNEDSFVKEARHSLRQEPAVINKIKDALENVEQKYQKIKTRTAKIPNAEKRAFEEVRDLANRSFHAKRALQAIENPLIIEKMGWGLRHSTHKKWIFAGSIVALGAVGFATYKLADYLVNGRKEKEYRAMVEQQRTAQTSAPTSGVTPG